MTDGAAPAAEDPGTPGGPGTASDAPAGAPRVVDVVVAGHRGDHETARRALGAADPRVREAALGALQRSGRLDEATATTAMQSDPDPWVRRRACDAAATLPPSPSLAAALVDALADTDALVVDAACWALGEVCAGAPAGGLDRRGAVEGLARSARDHADPRVREAAVAALGGIGDPAGLPAVLDACGDRPSVRRRAVVALAAFEGDEVADALRRAATDRDWQVREVAEILLGE